MTRLQKRVINSIKERGGGGGGEEEEKEEEDKRETKIENKINKDNVYSKRAEMKTKTLIRDNRGKAEERKEGGKKSRMMMIYFQFNSIILD
jgi:hypothetical protein